MAAVDGLAIFFKLDPSDKTRTHFWDDSSRAVSLRERGAYLSGSTIVRPK